LHFFTFSPFNFQTDPDQVSWHHSEKKKHPDGPKSAILDKDFNKIASNLLYLEKENSGFGPSNLLKFSEGI
jgi:hypothetical protein